MAQGVNPSITNPQEQAIRELLSRHPIAVDCALAAGSAARSAAEVVVFEAGRAFVVASTEADVLQPRRLLAVEERLVSESARIAIDGHLAAFAITNHAGRAIGSLTLLDSSGAGNGDVYHALARVVSTAASNAEQGVADESMEAAVLDGLRDAVVVLSTDMTIEWANRAVGSLIGRSPTDMVGRSALDLLHPGDLETALDALTRLSEGLAITRAFVRLERGNGGYERVEVTGADHSSHPALGGMVLSLRAAEVEEELEASVDRVMRMSDAVVAGLLDGIVATDEFGAITTVNGVAREMFGLDPHAPPSQLELDDFTFLDHDGRPISPGLQPALATLDEGPLEVCVMSASGELRYVSTHHRPVRDDRGELLGSVLVFHDITQARRTAEELRSQALHDQLTGLANRRQLEDRLGDLIGAETPHLVAACFIDLDGFKLVNDTHGHRIGDQLIRIAADRLHAKMRPGDLLVRQGGDEFVVLLIDVDDASEAVAAAERFRETLARPYTLDDDRFDLTASVGVSLSSTEHLADETLLRHADIALYAAKARGRDRVESFDAELATAVRLEERQRRMLRDALDNDRLVMHYQPLIDSETGDTAGYEALARCRDEDGTLVGPAVFMESITHSGLMWDLDQAAFALSCQAAAVLAKVTSDQPPVIACNFSAISLVQPNLVDFVVATTTRNGVSPAQICIEITESAAFEAGPNSLVALRQLHERGFLLALDDFGTGYSSLAHLRDLPLTSVKVDRSFITKLTNHSSERSIAEAIVSLASDLGLGVVAEGVETPQQLSQARQLGFSTIQGWHYSPAVALTEILSDWIGETERPSTD